MGVVDLSVHMRPTALMIDRVASAPPVRTEVRIVPIPKNTPGVPEDAVWAWALIQTQAGEQDKILVGGHAQSMSEAAARGELELRKRAVKSNG